MKFKDIFEKLGLTDAKWQWRAIRWDRQVSAWVAKLRGEKQHIAYHNKICQNCKTLMDHNEKRCPQCGAKMASWHIQVAGRAFSSLIPGGSTVTGTLIAANTLIFLAGFMVAGFSALLTPPDGFIQNMTMSPPLFLRGEYWRVFTHGYLHFGFIHILFNMVALFQAGSLLEEEIGKYRFFAVYTICMLGGGFLNVYATGMKPIYMAGASGAVFGLIGFGAVYGHFLGGPRGELLRNFFLRWVMYAVIFTFAINNISKSAHFGGLITGAFLGYLIEGERANHARLTPVWRTISRICLIATIGAFAWMFLHLFL